MRKVPYYCQCILALTSKVNSFWGALVSSKHLDVACHQAILSDAQPISPLVH